MAMALKSPYERIVFFRTIHSFNTQLKDIGPAFDMRLVLKDAYTHDECSGTTCDLREDYSPDDLLTFALTIEWHEDSSRNDIAIRKFAVHLIGDDRLVDAIEFSPANTAIDHAFAADLIIDILNNAFTNGIRLRYFGSTVACCTMLKDDATPLHQLPNFSRWLDEVSNPVAGMQVIRANGAAPD